MERKKLTAGEIAALLGNRAGWTVEGDTMVRRYKFANFTESLDFVNCVGAIAEEANHHPDITFGWGYAEISMTTHDRGGVTDVDFDLAKKIDQL